MPSTKLFYTALLIVVFLAGCYLFVFYSHRYSGFYEYTAFISIFFPVIGLGVMWIKSDDDPKWLRALKNFIPAVFGILVFYILFKMQSRYLDGQLHQYGVSTKAVVIDLTESHGRSGTHYHAIIEYKLGPTFYKQSINNDDHIYSESDTLMLVCSSHDPEIFGVISNLSAANKH